MPLTTRYMAAMHLARNAGALAHEFFAHRHFMFAGHSNADEFATRSIDTIRTLIRTKLAAAFPGDAIIDEGAAGSEYASLERAWIVDPISGTTNFLRGIPFYAVSMAYVERDCCEAGVIYDPEHDELFHVRRGDGAWCEHAGTDTRIEVAHCESLDGAVICVAHGERQPDPGYLIVRHELMDLGSTVRAIGTPALELAHVAASRCDGFVGMHVNSQALRAGVLLVEEAGGYTMRAAHSDDTRADTPLVASAPGIARLLTEAASPWSGRHTGELQRAPTPPVH